MSIGSGLAAAVNGFIDGRQVKHGWEDRKIDQKRQTRLDELREAAEVRAELVHKAFHGFLAQIDRLGPAAAVALVDGRQRIHRPLGDDLALFLRDLASDELCYVCSQPGPVAVFQVGERVLQAAKDAV